MDLGCSIEGAVGVDEGVTMVVEVAGLVLGQDPIGLAFGEPLIKGGNNGLGKVVDDRITHRTAIGGTVTQNSSWLWRPCRARS